MKIGLELFDLVRSLTQGENSSVRRALPPKKEALYGVFREMEKFDIDTVKRAFPKMSDANIATTAHQLIDLILKLLWNAADHNGMRDLVLSIGKIEILMRKGLFPLGLAKVEETIRLAMGLDAMAELLTVLRLKKEIHDVLHKAQPEDAEDIKMAQWAASGLEERGRFEDLRTLVFSLKNAPASLKASKIVEIEAYIQHLPHPKWRRNSVSLHWSKFVVAYLQGHLPECTREAASLVGLLDTHEELLADVQLRQDYFALLHYLVLFEAEEGRFSEATILLSKLERTAERYSNGISSDPTLLGRFTHTSLWLMLCKKEWDAARAKVRQILKDLGSPSSIVFTHKPVWLRMALLAAFSVRDFSTVRKLTQSLRTNLSEAYLGSAFVSSIGMFYLASIYEEGDEYLEQAVKHTRKWFQDLGCNDEYETIMLRFFERISKESTQSKVASLLDALKEELETLFENNLLWQHRELFPVMQWIQARQQGLEFKDVLFL